MIKLPNPPVLQFERSQPVQSEPVDVRVTAEGKPCGELRLPYTIWIRFNKLLHKGLERQQIEGPEAESAGLRVVVKGYVPELIETALEPIDQRDGTGTETDVLVYQGGVSNIAMEDGALDEADAKAIAAAERQAETLEKLGRTLAEGSENSDG